MKEENIRRSFTQQNQIIINIGKNRTFDFFPLEGEGGRRSDERESKTKTFLMNLKRHPLTCPAGHPLPQGRGDTARGFTLIELLVVVLIIGVLAAVAVPQYQFAVLKTKMNTILPLMKAIKDAEERHYLQHGEYVDGVDSLDIEVPVGDVENGAAGNKCYKNGTCFDSLTSKTNPNGWAVVGGIGSSSQGASDTCFVVLYLDHSRFPGVIECGKTRSNHPQCARLCKSLGYE